MTSIQLGIDFDRMEIDAEYSRLLMTDLLSKQRVDRYISEGFKDSRQCGNYVGELQTNRETGEIRKVFNVKTGEASHNSAKQVEARRAYKERQDRIRQNAIARKREEIARLQSELDEMEK